MILWEIFNAMDKLCVGIDSGARVVYNIFQGKQRYKEGNIMSYLLAEERMAVCDKHPEKQQLFYLEKMLLEAGFPYYFNFWEDLRPTPLNHDGGDPEKDIDWETYDFVIEIERPAGAEFPLIKVCFSEESKDLLDLLDMTKVAELPDVTEADGELFSAITAEQAMEIIEKFFETL